MKSRVFCMVSRSGLPSLVVRALTKNYVRRSWLSQKGIEVRAVRGVDLDLSAGKTLAIVGASGSGKSTLARCIAGIEPPTSGEMLFGSDSLLEPAVAHRHVQLIFQDPGASLNPRFSAGDALIEPAVARGQHGPNEPDIPMLLWKVGLPKTLASRLTSQLSGGQKARVAIARAIVALGDKGEPGLLILDESLSSLDLSVRSQVINLLIDLQEQRKLMYILITHDLTLAKHLADEVVVMDEGRFVERFSIS